MPQNRKNTEAQTQPRPHVQTVDSTLTTTKPPQPGKAQRRRTTLEPPPTRPPPSPHTHFLRKAARALTNSCWFTSFTVTPGICG